MRWDWSRVLDTQPPKVRVTKRCAASRPADGSSAEAPSLARRKNDLALPRELSAYQLHMKKAMAELKSSSPDMSAKERFAEAVRLWNVQKKIAASKATMKQGRERARERQRNAPPPDPEEGMFVTAPRKRPAAAPRRSAGSTTIPLGTTLSAEQRRQLADYNPARNATTLRSRARMHMLRGKSFKEAVGLAEGRDAREVRPVARPATARRPP